jgi:hypothetical protein
MRRYGRLYEFEDDAKKTFMNIEVSENFTYSGYLDENDPFDIEDVSEEIENLVHLIFDKLGLSVSEEVHDDSKYIASCTYADEETVLNFVGKTESLIDYADVVEITDGYYIIENFTLLDLCEIVGIKCDDFGITRIASGQQCAIGFDPAIVS